ncbi:aldo/keto reductase [Pelagibacteraceae bacterium]|nr:aldo/keto reductase [Pelagibacteraceae bacterium]
MEKKKKLIIGTANFGSNYGVNYRKQNLNYKKISEIIKIIKINKINYIDTARSYKNTEQLLGKFDLKNFNVITKIKNIEPKFESFEYVKDQLLKSLQCMKINKIYGLLIHNPKELKNKSGFKIYKSLKILKKRGLVKKIGYSINSPSDLDNLYKKFKPDLIQFPLNVFDQRILETGWLKKLQKDKVEIHVRSIFLQGILLKQKKDLPKKFLKFKKEFYNWYNWLRINKLNNLEGCLNFIFQIPNIKIIFGIDNIDQLNKIIKFKKKRDFNFLGLKSNKKNLITPSRWKII